MKADTLYNLWVATAALSVIFAISLLQAGCASRPTLPAVQYAEYPADGVVEYAVDNFGNLCGCTDSGGTRHVWVVGNE